MELTHEQIKLIEQTAARVAAETKAELREAMNAAILNHQHNCPKFEIGMGKMLIACLTSGVVVAAAARLFQ